MKGGVCCHVPIQSEYHFCGRHEIPVFSTNENFQFGVVQHKVFGRSGRKNGSTIVLARAGARFKGSAVQASLQGQAKLSSTFSESSFSASVDMMMSPDGLSGNWASSVRTVIPGKRWGSSNCSVLCSALRGGRGEQRESMTASNSAARWKGNRPIHLEPHTSAARVCPAAVSGGEEKVLLQQVPDGITTISSTGGHRSGFMYRPFVDFAVEELSRRPDVSPVLLKEEFRNMKAQGVSAATIDNKAFSSSKIRTFRIASIDTGSMQVLNVAGFASREYDLPIFCADFFSAPNVNIIVLDLNPLHDTEHDKAYKERFYTDLLPLVNQYREVLPWGDKLTAESLQFFSPLLLWTKPLTEDVSKFLYPAFQDYLQSWLNMVDSAHPTVDSAAIMKNEEAQHRYISWRTVKDPGRPLLTKLYGEQLAESYIKEFLFSGHSTLGTKSFLDYFPEYRSEDGSMCKQRSMIGRSFKTRPWDKDGNFSPKKSISPHQWSFIAKTSRAQCATS